MSEEAVWRRKSVQSAGDGTERKEAGPPDGALQFVPEHTNEDGV